jgi:hypothetical protein
MEPIQKYWEVCLQSSALGKATRLSQGQQKLDKERILNPLPIALI